MSDFILLSTICFVAMVSPGPDFVLVTRNSLTLAPSRGLGTALGIISGCFLHATFCTLGLALVITQNALLFSVVKYAGACYLIFLGIKGLVSRWEATDLALSPQRYMPSFGATYMQGFLCNLLNPKLAVFLLSLFTQFIRVDATLAQKVTVAAIFTLEAAIYWPLLVIVLQSKTIRGSFERFQQYADRGFGAILVGVGMKVALA